MAQKSSVDNYKVRELKEIPMNEIMSYVDSMPYVSIDEFKEHFNLVRGLMYEMTDPVGHKIKFDHVMIHDGDRIYRFRYDLKGWDTPPCYLPEEYLGKHLYDEDVDDVFMGRIVAWLVHSGIRTFSDLTACTYEQLKDLPGIGESLANVVKGRLAMIGLSLKPTVIVVDKEQESVDGNVKLLTE